MIDALIPCLVVPRQNIAIARTGKLQLAATDRARPAMNARHTRESNNLRIEVDSRGGKE